MSARARIRKRRALALVGVSGAALWAVSTFVLADTGINTANVQAGSDLSNGSATELTTLSSSLTRPNGNASIQAGVVIARIKLVKGYGSRLKVDIAWLDPRDADQVLNNPNAQIYAALYHPVAQGVSCTPANPQVASTQATINDDLGGGAIDYCTEVDTAATGSLISGGKLLLSTSNVSGYLKSSLSDSSTSDCDGTNHGNWCHPTVLTPGGATYNVLWVALTIVTPAGKPAGQQNNVNSLSFYTGVRAL